jgi:hypothetical protein
MAASPVFYVPWRSQLNTVDGLSGQLRHFLIKTRFHRH